MRRRRGPILHGDFLVGKGRHRRRAAPGGPARADQPAAPLRRSLPADDRLRVLRRLRRPARLGRRRCTRVDPLPMLWGLLRESAPLSARRRGAGARRPGLRCASRRRRTSCGSASAAKSARPSSSFASGRSRSPSSRARAACWTTTPGCSMYLLLVTKQVDVISGGASRTIAPPRGSTPAPRVSTPPRTPRASAGGRSRRALRCRRYPSGAHRRCRPRPGPRSRGRSSRPGMASRSKPPPGLAPDLAERWATIVDRARSIDRSDYFAMLDLARDSTKEEANKSFFALAKKWHPDRLAAGARAGERRVFARLRAHERGARHAHRRREARPLHAAARGRQRLAGDAGRRGEGGRGRRRLPEGRGLLQAKRPRAGRGALPQGAQGRPDAGRLPRDARVAALAQARESVAREGRRSPSRCSTRPSR